MRLAKSRKAGYTVTVLIRLVQLAARPCWGELEASGCTVRVSVPAVAAAGRFDLIENIESI